MLNFVKYLQGQMALTTEFPVVVRSLYTPSCASLTRGYPHTSPSDLPATSIPPGASK